MKGSKPFPFLVLALGLCAVLTACSTHTPSDIFALNIANTSVPDGVVLSPYTVRLVPSGGVGPYTWTLDSGTLPPGLTLSSGGVISGTPLSTDLNSDGTAKKYSFTVRVTDSQTPTAAYQKGGFSITINPLPMVTSTTLPDAFLGVQYMTTLTNSGGLSPFTWSITAGTLPPGLTLSASLGTISGTATGTGMTYPFTIQVTDADSNTASANVSITVKGKLQGSFAFSFNGYNNGTPFYIVGSFTGDGLGNISGFLDQNDPVHGPTTNTPFTGTYSISGTSNLGSMTFTIPALGVTYSYVLAVPLNGDVRFTLNDTNNPMVYGSGVIKAQTLPKIPGLVQFSGSYSLGFFGVDSAGHRSAGAGSFKTDSTGSNVTSGVEDTNDNGTVQSDVSITGGTVTADSDFTSTGRGTLTLTAGSTTQNYAFYVVNLSSEFVAVQTDSPSSGASLSLVSALKQCAGASGNCLINTATLNATAVMELNGATPTGPDVQLGVSSFDGQGNITLFQTDENNAGTVTRNTFTGTYTVDPNTGRVAVTGISSTPPVWYLVSGNRGFVIGTDPSATEGIFEPQSGGPFTLASFLLSYAGTTVQPVSSSVTNEADSTTIPAPGGKLVVTYDSSGPAGPMMNQMVTLPYVLDPNNGATTGAFFLTMASPPPPPTNDCSCDEIVYMVTAAAAVTGGSPDFSNNKWVSLNVAVPATGAPDPNPRITSVTSTHQ
jgi:hypothetical protein